MKLKKMRWPLLISLAGAIAVGFLFQNCAHQIAPVTEFRPSVTYSSVAAGNSHSCVIEKNGRVYCWGKNRYGLSGGPNLNTDVLTPVLQKGLDGVVQLAAGNDTNCALNKNGEVFCWGSNSQWGLGIQGAVSGPVPVKVLEGAKFIDGDYQHFCAVMNVGTVKCWGSSGLLPDIGNFATPTDVPGLTDVEKLNVGFGQACAVFKNKKMKCWGADRFNMAASAEAMTDVEAVDAGISHTCALKTDGSVWCWGQNNFGQSGVEKIPVVTLPNLIELPFPAKKIAAGANTSCALLEDGSVRCWGNNVLGQFGAISTQIRYTSEPTPAHSIVDAVDLSVGADHACAIIKNRSVRCWGVNAQGQLGNGSLALDYSASPLDVAGLPRL